MKYLLDGNIITELEDRRKPSYKSIRNRIAALSDEDQIYISIISAYEKHTGIGKKEIKRHTVDFILSSTAIETGAVVVSDDRIFLTIQEFWPSFRVESWK